MNNNNGMFGVNSTDKTSNKKRFRVIFWILVVVCGFFAGLYGALYRISDEKSLTDLSRKALLGTNRILTFKGDVHRRLFPRPTIILNDLTLTESDGKTPMAHAREVRIGVDWRSLFSHIQIEKLVVDDAVAVLSINAQGKWNFTDLLLPQQTPIEFNRVQINHSKVLFQKNEHQIEFHDIFYSQEKQQDKFPYTLNAKVKHDWIHELNFAAKGYAQRNPQGDIVLPNLNVQFKGEENQHDFSGNFASRVRMNTQEWISENNQLTVKSQRLNSHSNVTIDKIRQNYQQTQLNNLSSVFSGAFNPQQNFSGTFTLNDATWQGNEIQSNELTFDLLTQSANPSEKNNLNIHVSGDAKWLNQESISIPNLKLSTRQERASGLPRLVSEWTGQMQFSSPQKWQTQLQGMLDRQPAIVSLNRQDFDLKGEVHLAKLNLSHYLDQIEHRADEPYPSWLNHDFATQLNLNINTLVLPSLEINDLSTTLNANAQHIHFEPLQANLYGGHTEGSFKISNKTPLQYSLKQQADNVQIRPLMQDLFRNASLSGRGSVEIDFVTTGNNRQQLTENLSGNLNLNVSAGDWHGINIRELLNNSNNNINNNNNNINQLEFASGVVALNPNASESEEEKRTTTPFDSLIFKAKIHQGVSKHTVESSFTDPIVTMTSKGETVLYTGQINDDMMIYSNNKKNILPIRVTGTLDNPAISLNYNKITHGLKTTQQKKKAVEGALRKQWDWIKEQNKKQNQENLNKIPE